MTIGNEERLPRLWTLKEVSDETGFALRTLERDCRAGRVAHVHRGRERLMTAEQVKTLIAQHTTASQGVILAEVEKQAVSLRLARLRADVKRRESS